MSYIRGSRRLPSVASVEECEILGGAEWRAVTGCVLAEYADDSFDSDPARCVVIDVA